MDSATDNIPGPTTSAPTAGTLATDPLPALLSAMAQHRMTGVIKIESVGDIWLDDGRLYLAMTTSSPALSKLLFDGRLGTKEEIARVLRGDGGGGAGIGESGGEALDVLLGEHVDAEDRVRRLLHEQNLSALFEMLVPSEAKYLIESDQTHPIGSRFAEDVEALLAKAQQRMDIWRRIAARIPSTSAVFLLCESLPPRVDERVVTADEWRFLARLNGRNTVADVINETGESAFRVCSSLYRLLLEEVIEEAATGPSARDASHR